MKIILLTTASNSSGGARQALYLAEGLHSRKKLLAFFSPKAGSLRDLAPEIPWVDLPKRRWGFNAALQNIMRPALDQNEKIIVHAFHNKAVKLTALLGTWWKLRGLPVACAAHRGVIFPPKNPLPYLLPGIDAFIVNSQACADSLPLAWRRKRVHVVHNAVPPERLVPVEKRERVRESLGIPSDAFVFGCVTNNSPNKGVHILLDAFAALPDRTHLVIVGVRPEVWEQQCLNLGISRRTHLVMRTEHVADYLQIYDAFIIPSLSESQPNTLLEAMGMGLPAGGSAVGGIPELISNPDLLCPAGNAPALAEVMHRLLESPQLCRDEGERNRQAGALLAPSIRLEKILDIYQSILPSGAV